MTTSLPGHMSPGLSVEGSALLQAINSSLGPRIDTLGSRFDTANSQLAAMSHRMINIESAVNPLDGRMSVTEKSLEDVRHKTEILERKNVKEIGCKKKLNERLSTGSWWPIGTPELSDTSEVTILFIFYSS